jgi:FKBP-type peptidyl-prolyl cis-trans isomerase FkpA
MMMKRLIALMALLAVAGCGSSSPPAPTPSGGAPYSQQDLLVGTGATATAASTITVAYVGWLYDSSKAEGKGQQFDANVGIQFSLSGVIAGWVRGIPGMRVGGSRRLIIPPDLAYGAAGRPPQIPGNATLVFDITLLGVQ